MDAAFAAAADVRGRDAKDAARVSLALHASRTVDSALFLERDPALARDGAKALKAAGRRDLALRVELWAADSAENAKASGAVAAYLRGKQWAAGGAERAGLGWIRDVPRDAAFRAVISERLLLHAESNGDEGRAFAIACLEAELAELPAPDAFSRILRAAALAKSAEVVRRTQEGVGMGARGGSSEEALLDGERLAVALEVERQRAEGRTLVQVGDGLGGDPKRWSVPVRAYLLAHLAGRLAVEGEVEQARAMLDALMHAEEARRGPARAALSAAVALSLALRPEEVPSLYYHEHGGRFEAPELAFGGAAASRALMAADPALTALALMFHPEDHLATVAQASAAPLAAMLVREGMRGAEIENFGPAAGEALASVRKLGTRPAWEAYMRGLIVDGAAHTAAWHGSSEAWEGALKAARARGLSGFERAKLEIRAACEFERAAETTLSEPPWADFIFGGPPRPPVGAAAEAEKG